MLNFLTLILVHSFFLLPLSLTKRTPLHGIHTIPFSLPSTTLPPDPVSFNFMRVSFRPLLLSVNNLAVYFSA